MSKYAVAKLDEIAEIDDGREPMRPVRHHLGISAFGVNSWTGKNAGDRILNEHDEDEPDGNEELYFVHTGRARFELDGETVDAPAGSFVFAKPAVKRTAFAAEAETTIVAVGGVPGKAYESRGWEIWMPLGKLYQSGEYAEAADRGRELLKENPQYPALFYNVACVESLAGRKEDAIEHLREAIAGWEECREMAKNDSDFDAIREAPEFKALFADERQTGSGES